MASFEKRGNGVRAIVSFPDGRRQATFDTMAEARAWAAEMQKAKELGNVKHVMTQQFLPYGTLFDVYSIAQRAEQLFPESGAQISMLWRQKQVEYSQLSALSDPSPGGSRYYRPFRELTEAGTTLQPAKAEPAFYRRPGANLDAGL